MPSLINTLLATELKAAAGTASTLILVDHSKLNSEDTLKFRSDLRKAGAQLKVSKVRLLRKSIPDSAAKLIAKSKGSVGVVLAKDMVAASKIVSDLAKLEKLTVRGGLMDGAALDVAAVKRISELPSKHQLQGMLVNILAAPIVGFARVIAEIHKKQGGTTEAAPAATTDAAPAAATDAAPAV